MAKSKSATAEERLATNLAIPTETATIAIARLDGRISVSPVAKAWKIRAAWAGYARALQLQGQEIDEIDVFSWGCGLEMPQRPRRSTHGGEFEPFAHWYASLAAGSRGQWRDELPFSPTIAIGLPLLFRAIDLVRQFAERDASPAPWLALPRFLHLLGMTDSPLPCLAGGAKVLRIGRRATDDEMRSIVKQLTTGARRGLELLDDMEDTHRFALKAITLQRKPGALLSLLVLSQLQPLLSPKSVSERLGQSLSGAGKLLDRAAALGMLVEISGRGAWKRYIPPDLAISFGLKSRPRGRPPAGPVVDHAQRDTSAVLDAFDREMADFEKRYGSLLGTA